MIGLSSRNAKSGNCAIGLQAVRFRRHSGSGKSSKRAETLLLTTASLLVCRGLLRYWFKSNLNRASLSRGTGFLRKGPNSPLTRVSRRTAAGLLRYWFGLPFKCLSTAKGVGLARRGLLKSLLGRNSREGAARLLRSEFNSPLERNSREGSAGLLRSEFNSPPRRCLNELVSRTESGISNSPGRA